MRKYSEFVSLFDEMGRNYKFFEEVMRFRKYIDRKKKKE